jgi:hypothetical protein
MRLLAVMKRGRVEEKIEMFCGEQNNERLKKLKVI